jgi:hypothetical protein
MKIEFTCKINIFIEITILKQGRLPNVTLYISATVILVYLESGVLLILLQS